MADSLTDEILRNKYYEKWNGELPEVMGADATVVLNGLDGSTKAQ